MKLAVTLAAMIVAVGMTVAPALAADPSSSSRAEKSDTHFKTSQAGYEAQHTMTGTVTSLDRKTGMVDLKTDEGTLKLHFPPSQIQNIKDGERVTVELGIRPEGSPSASPATSSPSHTGSTGSVKK